MQIERGNVSQNLHSYPAHEATFHERSYGFRPGRSAHDAQKILFINLNSNANGINKRVIELDIERCFDKISHTTIMDNLIAPLGIRNGIFRCLKAGINPEFPEQGTPQGGVVSPLLANIALNGIESIHKYKGTSGIVEPSIRYADDMVIILRPQEDATAILDKINEFLASRGMKVSEKKTKITAATERVHLHHIDGNHNNWKAKNLLAVHESCHDYTHMSKGCKS